MENTCVLKLEQLVFDEISFKRIGFKSHENVNFEFGFNFDADATDEEMVIARISVVGTKASEYKFEVRASGYFHVSGQENDREVIIHQNAVAILFPYVRSQITLLTSQPEVDPIVLPPINIAKMVEDAMASSNSEKN